MSLWIHLHIDQKSLFIFTCLEYCSFETTRALTFICSGNIWNDNMYYCYQQTRWQKSGKLFLAQINCEKLQKRKKEDSNIFWKFLVYSTSMRKDKWNYVLLHLIRKRMQKYICILIRYRAINIISINNINGLSIIRIYYT